ncbi:type II toxin-antitoxin system HicB family antitoxin [Thiohalorhabdus sp.]|uniref:type II toxin-antitoxin system HicB family antitoxin n=1 Tax=Thiohalorhabdus sp. TaxID=3094134 RepID=UPI002FC28164
MFKNLTAVIEKEDELYLAFCPEVDVTSQGDSIEEAKANLQEALELFFETASPEEVDARFHEDVFVTSVGVAVGEA